MMPSVPSAPKKSGVRSASEPPASAVGAAQAMGVYSTGSDVQRLKEQIIKALNV